MNTERLIRMTEEELCETNGGVAPILAVAAGIGIKKLIGAGVVILGSVAVAAGAGVVVADCEAEAEESKRRYEESLNSTPTPVPTPTPTPVPVY